MKLGDLFIKLGLQKQEYDKGLDDAKKKTTTFSDSVTDNTKKAGKSFNGLQFQVNQFARELPALGFGINMFIAAISNNLPMLTDEIKKAKEANQALAASGQKGIPVWKQMAQAIVSWQTAIIVGITLMVVYGRDIQAFVMELFKGTDAIDSMAKGMQKHSETAQKFNKSMLEELTALKLRHLILNDNKRSDFERKKAAQEMIDMFPDLLSGYTAEQLMLEGSIELYGRLRDAIIKTVEAKFAEQQIMENYKKIAEEQKKFEKGTWYGNTIRAFSPTFVNDFITAKENIDKLTEANNKLFDSFAKGYKNRPLFGNSTLLNEFTIKGKNGKGKSSNVKENLDKIPSLEKYSEDLLFGLVEQYLSKYADQGNLSDMSSHWKKINEDFKNFTDDFNRNAIQFTNQLNQIIESGMMDAISTFSSGLTELALGDINIKDFGYKVLDVVGKFMQTLGAAIIVYSEIFKQFIENIHNPWATAGLGIALFAAGAAISTIASNGMSKQSSASGSYSTPSGYANSTNSSAVAAIQGNVVFELQGTTLKGVLNNTDRKNTLIR